MLDSEIKRKKIRIHSITHRIKRFDSFRDKVREKSVRNPFTEIHDIVGLRVICLFLSDIEIVKGTIKGIFETIKEESKIDAASPDIFGYMAVHLDVKLKEKSPSNPNLGIVRDIPFEVQIKTIAQDAWASVSHNLDYKHIDPLPVDFKRDLYALSGLFYVADTHFEMLKKRQSDHLTERYLDRQ
jgi:ppGpp synthetase/RelA/SpoT-type nucleotidyltranferase